MWPLVRALARERALGGVMAAPDAIFPGPLNYTRFRRAFGRPNAVVGPQPDDVGGALAWLLPNPSGLNAHYQPPQLAVLFREAWEAAR